MKSPLHNCACTNTLGSQSTTTTTRVVRFSPIVLVLQLLVAEAAVVVVVVVVVVAQTSLSLSLPLSIDLSISPKSGGSRIRGNFVRSYHIINLMTFVCVAVKCSGHKYQTNTVNET